MEQLTLYKDWLQLNYRDTTIKTYYEEAIAFTKWWSDLYDKPYAAKEVIALDIAEYKQYLTTVKKNRQGKRLSMVTVNKKLESIRNYFNFLFNEKHITNNPATYIKTQRIHSGTMQDPRWLDRNEKNRFLRFIDDTNTKKQKQSIRNRAMCYLMLHAGLRVSEVAALRLDDIDLMRGIIIISDGKGGKMRRASINKDLNKALSDWLEVRGTLEHDFLFVSQKGTPFTIQGIEDIFKKIRKETQIEDLTPHVLRHTFCHDLIQKGYSIHLVADMAGHSDINTTRLYTRSSEDERKQAVESLSAIE